MPYNLHWMHHALLSDRENTFFFESTSLSTSTSSSVLSIKGWHRYITIFLCLTYCIVWITLYPFSFPGYHLDCFYVLVLYDLVLSVQRIQHIIPQTSYQCKNNNNSFFWSVVIGWCIEVVIGICFLLLKVWVWVPWISFSHRRRCCNYYQQRP